MRISLLLAFLLGSLSACTGSSESQHGPGHEDDAGIPAEDAGVPPVTSCSDRVTADVEAAKGATSLLDDGAKVVLPANVLADDAEVTLSPESCAGVYASSRFRSCVYRG